MHMLGHLGQPALVMLNVSDAWESLLLTLLALIDPFLLRMNVNTQDHSMATFDSTIGSSRFQTPILSNTEVMLNRSTSLPHGNVQEFRETGLQCLEQKLTLQYRNSQQTSCQFISSHSTWWLSPQWVWPDTPQMWKLSTLDPSLGLTSGSCNPTKESESSISLLMGGCESQGSLDKDTDADNPMTSLLKAQTPVYDCDEGMNLGRSHELPPDDPPFDIMQECSDGMEIMNTEGDAHQCVLNNNICSGHTVPETRVHTPYPGPGFPYPTPDSTPLDAPTPPSRVLKSAEATSSDIRTPSNIRSGQSWSKMQPTVKDAPDDTDSATPDYSYANDDNFRESDIESAIDESLGFLQDTSSGIEDFPPSDKRSISVESTRSTSVSTSSSENDHSELPHEENADRFPVSLGCETSRMLHHKRKFSAIELDWVGLFRNFRRHPGKRRDGNQCYDNKTSEEARETSISEGALPRSTAGAAHTKTRVSSKSEKDKWKGCFSCHPSLSDLSADKDEIERKCNCILCPDLPDFLEKHTKSWKSSGFWHSPSLDVSRYPCYTPTNTRGFATWRYVEVMQADKATYYLKSRLADIMLYLEYVRELDR